MPVSNTTISVVDASGNSIVVPTATAVPNSGVMVMGSDGTNSHFISTDASGHPIVVGDGTAGTPAGGVVSVQGVSSGTALPISAASLPLPTGAATSSNQTTLGTQTTEINDGTHTATIKAASTAAVAGDTAIVVAVSPNNSVAITAASLPLPTGAATASNQTTLGTQTTELNDGTHTATIKAASTAAAAADTSLVVAQSPNSPSPAVADLTGTGTITALNGSVTWGVQGMSGQSIQILGTWSGTIAFQFSNDGGTTWWADEVQSAQGSSGVIQSTTVNGMWFSTGLGGYRQYRVTATAWTSGTANITWDAGVGNNALSTVTNIVDGAGNGPAGVAVASTQATAAQPSLVVAVSPNSIAAKDRTSIGFGTQMAVPIAGSDNGVARIARIGEFGTQRTTSEIMLWHDAFEGSTVNAFWTQSVTTMTIAQATGVLTLNNSNITTLNTDAIITSQRQFPKYPRNPLYVRFRGLLTANAAANHTFVEMGLGAPSGVTATINNGAFFRWTSAGNLNAVVSYAGSETSTQILAQGVIVTTSYYYYDVIVDDDYARFIVSDASGTPIVDTQLDIALTSAFISAVSHLPAFARVYVDATGGGTATQLKLSAHSVQIMDGLINASFGEQMAYSMRSSIINPTSYAQTPQLAAGAAPATITPNSTGSTAYTTLGGEYAVALTAGSENLLAVFAFTIPTPYSFTLTNLTWQTPVVTTAISVTGIPFIEWAVIVNSSSVSPATGGGFRFTPGLGFSYTTITQAAGVPCTLAGNNNWLPQVPIVCLPGTVLILAYKVLVTTAAGTPGVTRGSIYVGGYFK